MRAADISKITLLRRPDVAVPVFLSVCANGLIRGLAHVATHATAYAALVALTTSLLYVSASPPTPFIASIVSTCTSVSYWTILGILSSIGLGSGLHTFLLFLGPHIARVASEALAQGSTDFNCDIVTYYHAPSRWDSMAAISAALTPTYADDAFTATTSGVEVSMLAIARLVLWPAFFWGAGTAVGELPPYFIARAAARAGEALEELTEVDDLERNGAAAQNTMLARAKVAVYEAIQRYGFIAILLAASIPNPLFDLAGLTCGYMGISFTTFFLATFIGKAVIKVSLQVFFVIASAMYGSAVFDTLLAWPALQSWTAVYSALKSVHAAWMKSRYTACTKMPDCSNCCTTHFTTATGVDECAAACSAPTDNGPSASLLSQAWGWVIVIMVLYFLISIVNAAVQERLLHDAAVAAVATPSASSRVSRRRGEHKQSTLPVHMHGAQLVSALVNADELSGVTSPTADWRAPSGLGDPEPHFVRHTLILNKSQRLSMSPARQPGGAAGRRASPSPARTKRSGAGAVQTYAVAAAASKRAQPQRRLSSSLSRTPARVPVTRSRSRSRSRR